MKDLFDKQKLIQIAHGGPGAASFCREAGIDSVRNLEIYLKKGGIWDGHAWTYGELAAAFGISRPRAVQICQTTEKYLKSFFGEAK